jgi:hypothetical protein
MPTGLDLLPESEPERLAWDDGSSFSDQASYYVVAFGLVRLCASVGNRNR